MSLEMGGRPSTHWESSRAGARAARGFHFQDAVGAWLGAGIIGHAIPAGFLSPEADEDLTLEAATLYQIQVKSRQSGEFSAAKIAGFIDEMWTKEQARKREHGRTSHSRLVLILEKGFQGYSQSNFGTPIGGVKDFQHAAGGLRAALASRGITNGEIEEIFECLHIRVLEMAELVSEATGWIAGAMNAHRIVAHAAFERIRTRVAEAADQNAQIKTHDNRAGITATDLVSIVATVMGWADRNNIDQAIKEGFISAVEFSANGLEENYFKGTAAEPWHVGRGLTVQRPDLIAQASEALDSGHHVLLKGVSGAGKSTVAWQIVRSRSATQWFRVRDLRPGATQVILDFAKFVAPTEQSHLGLVVDGVGIGRAQEWDNLVERLADLEFVELVGSVRIEDLPSSATSPEVRCVEVVLSEELAEGIHANLAQRGMTAVSHWREAFNNARGLTMEYCHMLVAGDHMRNVLKGQIVRLVDGGQDDILRILSLIATLDRWGLESTPSQLGTQTGLDSSAVRLSLKQLADEHLLLQKSTGVIAGLHQLRSTYIAELVHEYPPPTEHETIRTLLKGVESHQIAPLIEGVIRDTDFGEHNVVLAISERLQREFDLSLLVEALGAMKRSQMHALAEKWNGDGERLGVDRALRPVAVQMAIASDPLDSSLDWKPGFRELSLKCGQDIAHAQVSRELLDALCGLSSVIDAVVECENTALLARLFHALGGLQIGSTERELLLNNTVFREFWCEESNIESLTEFLNALRHFDISLAVGYQEKWIPMSRVRDLVFSSNPWVVDLCEGSQEANRDFEIRMIANPTWDEERINKALVAATRLVYDLLPNAGAVAAGSYLASKSSEYTPSRLVLDKHIPRRALPSSIEVSANRQTIAICLKAFGSTSATLRAEKVLFVLNDLRSHLESLAKYILDVSGARCPFPVPGEGVVELVQSLQPGVFLDERQVGAPDISFDPVYSLADSVYRNLTGRIRHGFADDRSLVAFLRTNIRGQLTRIPIVDLVVASGRGDVERMVREIDLAVVFLADLLSEFFQAGSWNPSISAAAIRKYPSERIWMEAVGSKAADVAVARLKAVARRFMGSSVKMGGKITMQLRSEDLSACWPRVVPQVVVRPQSIYQWLNFVPEPLNGDEQLVLPVFAEPIVVVPEIGQVRHPALARRITESGNVLVAEPVDLTSLTERVYPVCAAMYRGISSISLLSSITCVRRHRDSGALHAEFGDAAEEAVRSLEFFLDRAHTDELYAELAQELEAAYELVREEVQMVDAGASNESWLEIPLTAEALRVGLESVDEELGHLQPLVWLLVSLNADIESAAAMVSG